ncbi:MAG: ROK family transcriptional regulator [Spirochaetaceae bacterium]
MTRRPLRSYDVRERNEKLVLQIIYRERGISQSEVAQQTGLKPPTVFRIFSQLESDGVICECTPERGTLPTKGRKPAYYCVVPDSVYTIGIDFWSGSAAVVVSDFAGTAVHSEVLDVAARAEGNVTGETMLEEISALVRRSIEQSKLSPERLLGIGVGAPGIVDIESGTVVRYPRIPGLDGSSIKERLEEEFGWPVYVHNNTAVIALGEYRYGAAAGYQSVVASLVRSGVGGAFLKDGRILTNRGRTVLEIGHIVLDPNGPPCSAGWRGCVESYLSEEALSAALRRAGYAGLDEAEAEAAHIDGDSGAPAAGGPDGTGGADAADAGDRGGAGGRAADPKGARRRAAVLARFSEASPELDEAARRFAQVVHNLSNLLNPEAYLIVSRYRWVSEFLAGAVDHYRDADSPGLSEGAAAVLAETYDPLLACRGAADLVLDHFFEEP